MVNATAPGDRHAQLRGRAQRRSTRPGVPRQGARWVVANPEPAMDGRAPHRQPRNPSRREVNRMRRLSLEELQRQLEEDGGCEAIDGCFVEPDGTCEHGQPSWLLALGLT